MNTAKITRFGLPVIVMLFSMPALSAKTLDEKLLETEMVTDFGKIAEPIMTDRERKAFRHLTNDQQRLVFIRNFWDSRDPDPDTPGNEFKESYMETVIGVYKRYGKGANGLRSHQAILYLVLGAPHERRTFFSRRHGPVEVWTYWSTPRSVLPPQYTIVFSNNGLRNVLFTSYPSQTRTDRRLNSTFGTLGLSGLPYELARAVEEINELTIVNPSTPS